MSNYRVQIGFPFDTTLPRDVVTLNPHYNGTNPQALADKLKTNLQAVTTISATKPFTIKVYDVEKAPPSYPLATASQTGTPYTASTPREIALCLSYYSSNNIPRQRGRMYIPYLLLTGSLGGRPTPTQITEVLTVWGNALFKNVGPTATPIVWSKFNKAGYPITNLWVDDEWDIQRSRGGKPTTRQTATIP